MERHQVIQHLADLLTELELAERYYLECYRRLESTKHLIREKEAHIIATNEKIRQGKNKEIRRALLDEELGFSLLKAEMDCKNGLAKARSRRNQLIRRYESTLLSAKIALSPYMNFEGFNKLFS